MCLHYAYCFLIVFLRCFSLFRSFILNVIDLRTLFLQNITWITSMRIFKHFDDLCVRIELRQTFLSFYELRWEGKYIWTLRMFLAKFCWVILSMIPYAFIEERWALLNRCLSELVSWKSYRFGDVDLVFVLR